MKRIEKAHLPTSALTHPGMTGKNNEDRFGVSAYVLEDKNKTPALLAILSDGIGGHRAGEVASEMVVDHISQYVAQSDGNNPVQTLEQAIHGASEEVFTKSQADTGRKGMGATVSCVWIINSSIYTATVGDSRIYLIRDNRITQVSTDHTWIQEAIESGIITPEQAVGHPNAHIIRRYVGSSTPPEVDFRLRLDPNETNEQSSAHQGMPLKAGDRLLLCSDGLSDLVKDYEILATFQQFPQDVALQKLVDLANSRGGHDNITLVTMQVPETVESEAKGGGIPWIPVLLGFVGVLVVAGLAVGGFFAYRYLLAPRDATPTVVTQTLPAVILTGTKTLSPSVTPTSVIARTATLQPVIAETTAGSGNVPPPPNQKTLTVVATDTKAIPPTSTRTPTSTVTSTP